MFNTKILRTPFSSQEASMIFSNVSAQAYQNDVSFLSTLRALVYPRMKDEDIISTLILNFNTNTSYIERYGAEKAIRDTYGGYTHPRGCITICNMSHSSSDERAKWIDMYKNNFEKYYNGWQRLEKITDFFCKTFEVICFVQPESKKVILFTEGLEIKKYHYLQCAIFAFLPWYFNPDDGMTEDEMALIKSLRERSAAEYDRCISKIAEQYDFRKMKINRLLDGFETKFDRAERDAIREEINSCYNSISDLNARIGDYIKSVKNKETLLLGLESKIAAGNADSEIKEYFLCNNKLSLESVTDSSITFVVKDYLTYFDEDIASDYIENENSVIYYPDGHDGSSRIPTKDMKMLMTAIFVDQKLRIRFCSAYTFNLRGSVSGVSHYNYDTDCATYMPNPHIEHYNCLGDYHTAINELLVKRDYITAIEQTAASCKSLNFADGTVFEKFMCILYGYDNGNRTCIELPDGSVVNPESAIEWLKKQEEKTDE